MGQKEGKTARTELDDETIDRLTKNTNYTAEQIRQWHEAFMRDCPSGKLSSRQFTEVYKKFYPEYEAEKYSAQVFRTFDMDGNGYIDFVEFLLAVNVNSNGDIRDKLGLAFDIYDINANGQVRESKGHFVFHLRLCKYIQ
jgi:Ca2+-binding EF-hand superfamily protein